MRIKDIPKANRPRERFLKKGADALSDAELFAILLRIVLVADDWLDGIGRVLRVIDVLIFGGNNV